MVNHCDKKMKKIKTIQITIFLILLVLIPTSLASPIIQLNNENITLNTDVELGLCAGKYGLNLGSGIGYIVKNNRNESINVSYSFEYYTLLGEYLNDGYGNIIVPPNWNGVAFNTASMFEKHPIIRVTAHITFENQKLTRSGFGIWPFIVILK